MDACLDTPLDQLDPSRPDGFADRSVNAVFARLRREAPVHYCANSEYGPYWSICNYKDVVEVEALPAIFSSASEWGGVSIMDSQDVDGPDAQIITFIAMDAPEHTAKRRVVAPAFTPSEIVRLSDAIRQRTIAKLDSLPRGEVFDWTEQVSTSLTTDMLASLFDFPWDERHKLPVWSDAITSFDLMKNRPEERQVILGEIGARMHALWQERAAREPSNDLLSMMIHSNALGSMSPMEFMGNMMLLIVGGNDTTRNTMSGLIDAFNQWPEEWDKIRANPELIPNAVSEIVRWQCPVVHMRRTAVKDVEFRGHQLRQGDKVVLWYASANRDETVFPDGDRFIADRPNARRHLSFGYGVHRCVGARLAELQVQTLLSEMVKRDMQVELAGEIVRDDHPLFGIVKSTPVRITAG